MAYFLSHVDSCYMLNIMAVHISSLAFNCHFKAKVVLTPTLYPYVSTHDQNT